MGISAKNPLENDDKNNEDSSEYDDVLLTEVHHVAIAVFDLDEAIEEYRETWGVWVDHREMLEVDGVEVAILKVGGSDVQLLTPTRDDSPLAAFLDERGSGLHHLAYTVGDCAAALETAREAGHELVDEEPRQGVRDSKVAFIHPRTMFGTLVLLVEDRA